MPEISPDSDWSRVDVSFKRWLAEDADRNRRLAKQDKVKVGTYRPDPNAISPWHQQRKMKG